MEPLINWKWVLLIRYFSMCFLLFRVPALNSNLFTLSTKQSARPFADQVGECFQISLQFLFFWSELICLQKIWVTTREKSHSIYAQIQTLKGLRRCWTSTRFLWLAGASALLTTKPEILWQPAWVTEEGMVEAECLDTKSKGKEPVPLAVSAEIILQLKAVT